LFFLLLRLFKLFGLPIFWQVYMMKIIPERWHARQVKKDKKFKQADQILPEVYGTTLNLICKIGCGHICQTEIDLSFNNNYIT
jgi:hypothetical protein